jgi:DNA helicase-2/ATP-dependent DNA helicase PcrA
MPPPSGFVQKLGGQANLPSSPANPAPKAAAPVPQSKQVSPQAAKPAAGFAGRSAGPAQGARPVQTRPVPARGVRSGATVQHPKYGRGVVLRREGEGEDAKLTISFPGHGLKKIVEKYAGIKVEE